MHFEVDSTESVWYIDLDYMFQGCNFEVDSTESVWYNRACAHDGSRLILKLTPQSQYGIRRFIRTSNQGAILKLTPQSQYGIRSVQVCVISYDFEVDSTESVWYMERNAERRENPILKLTPQSQYGIASRAAPAALAAF